ERSLSHTPVFQVMLVLQNAPQGELRLPGLRLSPQELARNMAQFDLTLSMREAGDEIVGVLNFASDLFEEATVQRWAGYLQRVLGQMSRDTSRILRDITVLDEGETGRLLGWSEAAEERPYPRESLIHELFEAHVRRTPQSIAVLCEDERLTYAQLSAKSNQLARYLRARGVGADQLVAICLERGAGLVVGILGILKAGAAYVPLDASYPPQRLQYMLENAGPGAVITQSSLRASIPGSTARTICLDSDWAEIEQHSAGDLDGPELTAENLAYVIFTSGSTGKPKGIAVSHRNVVRLVSNRFVPFEQIRSILCAASPSFDAFTFELWGALLHGKRSVLLELKSHSLQELRDVIREQQVDCAWLTAGLFNQVMANAPQALGGLKYLLVGGEALSKEHIQRAREQLPAVSLINGYGPTENTTFSCTYPIRERQVLDLSSIPIGAPIDHSSAYVLDEHGALVPSGCVGELYVGGAGLARGYLDDAALTARQFLPHPYSTIAGARLYRTGDLVRRRSDGNLEFVGRRDEQVKVRGFRIELGEVESALALHEQVKAVAVVSRTERANETRLIAYVVAHTGMEASEKLKASLLSHIRERVPDYAVPGGWVFLESLPLTVNGKLDRARLPAPDELAYGRQRYVAPTSALEEILVTLWQSNLQVSQIGTEDNYFAIGGDSIRSIGLVSAARAQGVLFSVKDLFAHPTIAQLATVARQGTSEDPAALALVPFALLSERERAEIPEQYRGYRVEDAYPMSLLQQGMWFHTLHNPGSSVYHCVVTFAVNAAWVPELFQQALEILVARHAMLRTRFHFEAERPLQLVLEHCSPVVSVRDYRDPAEHRSSAMGHGSGTSADEASVHLESRDELIRAWVDEERTRGLSLDELWRVGVLVFGGRQIQFGLSFHHALWDGWSDATLTSELFSCYQALLQGAPPALSAPPPAYRHYIALEQAALSSAEHQDYWTQTLADAQLPWWSAYPKREAKRFYCPISPQISAAMMALTAELGVQEKSVWCAVYLALTALLDGGESIVGSVVTHGRPEIADAEKTVGLFLNSLPIHLKVRDCTWADWVMRVDERLQELQQHRHYPLARIQAQLHLEFSASLFNFVSFHVLSEAAEHSNVQGFGGFGQDEINYAFVVDVHKNERSAGHMLRVTVDSSVFDAEFQDRIRQYIANIIGAMTTKSRCQVDRTSLLSTDLHRVRAFNATKKSYPQELVHELFEGQARKSPLAIAVEDGAATISYGELDRKASTIARWLRREGAQVGDRVGVCLERSIGMVAGILGVLKAGCAYVPIDPEYPGARIEYIVGDAALRGVLTERSLCERLGLQAKNEIQWWCLDEMPELGESAGLDGSLSDATTSTADNAAYVIYTSGSTGEPKGVVGRHGSVVNRLQWMKERYPEAAGEVFCQKTSIGFVDHVAEIFQALSSGGRLVLIEAQTVRSPPELLESLARLGMTRLTVVPSLLQALLGDTSPVVCEAMRLVISSGEALVMSSGQAFQRRFPNARLLNLYGSTEVGADVSSYEVQADESGSVAIGRPIANSRLYVLSGTGELLPRGSVGELYVGGAGLAQGYWGRGGLTAERFVPDPFSGQAGARLFRTGDLVRSLASGELEYLGRADHQVKLRGFRIELGEIESRLAQHEQVDSCVVVAREDAAGERRLVAYYTRKLSSAEERRTGDLPQALPRSVRETLLGSGREMVSDGAPEALPRSLQEMLPETPSVEELREHLRCHLPEYMVPSAFVMLHQMPLTPSGKIDRRSLPAPGAEAYAKAEYEPPRGEIEIALAQIWQELLKVDRVGRADNFFALGGHSLLAVQLVSRVRQVLGRDLSVRAVFEQSTVRALAAHLQAAAGVHLEPILRAERAALTASGLPVLPLSWSQERLWFIDQLEGGSAAYHIAGSVRLHGVLDKAALQRALDTIVERHEVLRTTFRLEEGRAIQVIAAVGRFALQERDLRPMADVGAGADGEARHRAVAAAWESDNVAVDGMALQRPATVARQNAGAVACGTDNVAAAVAREASEESSEPFDLTTGPLIRGRLLQLAEDEHVLLVTMHHIVSDGWSIGILLQELSRLYAAYREGRSNPLPQLPIQYADYAQWQRRWLQGEVLQEQLAYWQKHLAGAPELLQLPTDRTRPLVQRYRGGEIAFGLGESLSRRLKELSQQQGTTLFMTLYAGFAVLLSKLSGQQDLVIGTAMANRQRTEVEDLIGFFVNTLALRATLAEGLSVSELLTRVKETTLGAYAHQGTPFEQVVDVLHPRRSLSHSPVFQVMFMLQNAPQSELQLPGLTLSSQALKRTVAQFDLTLSMREVGGEIAGVMNYASDLFEEATIQRWAVYLRRVYEQMVRNTHQTLRGITVLDEREQEQLLRVFNATEKPYPKELIHELFEAQARKSPLAIAVEDGAATISYGELDRKASTIARWLRREGAQVGDRVG
ncbi:MAG TPA: amino acid adenylation domain-containing protein, partial [Steroidobacteraceae bacterium]